MKKTVADTTWLPAREEWDFRAVTPAECRVACHWEYARDIQRMSELAARSLEEVADANNPARKPIRSRTPLLYCPANYRQAARELFPQPWLSLTREQRTNVAGSFYPLQTVQVRKLGDFLQRMQWAAGAHLDVLRPCLEHSYVVQPNFSLHGVEAVIKDLAAWARKEARNYPPSPRAKAAELPFDALKWLAVSRLEDARRKARVSFQQAQQTLVEYRRKKPLPHPNDVFPIYASHGAWSKARADANRCRNRVLRDSSFLLTGLV